MTITTQATNLLEDVVGALARHDQAKATYLTQRDTLTTLGKRLEKHRATASAARHESETAGAAWRAAFRESDGELTSDTMKKKRIELDKRELAEQYEQLVAELVPSYQLAQIETAYARLAYDHAQVKASVLHADHCFATASTILFATNEGRAWLKQAKRKRASAYRAVVMEDRVGDGITISGQTERTQAAHARFQQALSELLDKATQAIEIEGDESAEVDLHPVALTVFELSGREASSPSHLNRKRNDLQTLLGHQRTG